MRKRHSVALALIHLLVLASSPFINCVQIDNELVSKPHCKYIKKRKREIDDPIFVMLLKSENVLDFRIEHI